MKNIFFALLLLPSLSFANDFVTDVYAKGGTLSSVSIDSRYAYCQNESYTFFSNLKGAVAATNHTYTPHSNSAFFEGNAGLGLRFNKRAKTFGIYSYIGKLKTPYHNTFSRATFGIECFADNYRGYLNIYTPIGKSHQTIDSKYGFNKFRFGFNGNDLNFQNYGKQEVMSSFAAEIGLQKNFGKLDARINAHYHAAAMHANRRIGGNLSLSYSLASRLQLTATTGYDSFYKTQGQIGLAYSFGTVDDTSASLKYSNTLPPVYLEEFLWLQRSKKVFNDTIVKSDLYFVDSARVYGGGFQGDGSYEYPFLNASLANTAISTVPDATLYFYQGIGNYQDFGTFDLIGTQTITGQGGNVSFQNILVLPGSNATRPFLARNATQEMMNTPLITLTDGGNNLIENIGLVNASGNVATGGSVIRNVGTSINSLTIQNVVAQDKVTLFLLGGSQKVNLYNNDIYGVDIKTFNNTNLNLQVENNTFRTNRMIAQRFFQPIGASLFLESLNASTFTVDSIMNNTCFNTTLNGNRHLGFGYLSSGSSVNTTPNGFLYNTSIGKLPPAAAGAFLIQGLGPSRVNINGCYGNFSALDNFVLQSCDINIRRVGFPPNAAGLSQANNNTLVSPFGAVNIFNSP
jgi:hypothetical protein